MSESGPNPSNPSNQPNMLGEDAPREKVDISALHAPIMREKHDPRDGYEPVPVWLVAVFGGLLFWGGYYLATYSGGFRSDVLDEDPTARYAGGGAVAPKPLDPIALGQRLFMTCAACHQANGQGGPGYPPLVGSEWVVGEPARLKRILLHGMEGPVSVRGQMYNGNMPAFAAKYTDEQIAAVLTYIRQAWGNSAGPIPPDSVTATRMATRARMTPWTAAELLAVTADEYTAPPATVPATLP